MKLEMYGLVLEELVQDDIELLRSWRTSEKINQFMIFRDLITPQMQQAWFDELQEDPYRLYFIVRYRGERIGIIHGSYRQAATPGQEGLRQGGIFFYDDRYWETFVPVLASLCLIDFGTYYMGYYDKDRIQVRKDNKRAIAYNKQLGYVVVPDNAHPDDDSGFWVMELDPRTYEERVRKLRHSARIVTKHDDTITVTLDEADRRKGRLPVWRARYAALPPDIAHRFRLVDPFADEQPCPLS